MVEMVTAQLSCGARMDKRGYARRGYDNLPGTEYMHK